MPRDEPSWDRQRALLQALLYDGDFQRARTMGTADLPAAEARFVATIDDGELDHTVQRIGRDVRRRRQRGSDTLEQLFQDSLASGGLGPRNPETARLFSRFAASAAYRSVRETPDGVSGDPVEVGFARFLEQEQIGDPATRRRELIWGLLRSLAVTPTPAFEVPSPIRPCPGGWFAVDSGATPVLMAAVGGRLIRGAVTQRIAQILLAGPSHPGGADPSVERLVRLGLLARAPGTRPPAAATSPDPVSARSG